MCQINHPAAEFAVRCTKFVIFVCLIPLIVLICILDCYHLRKVAEEVEPPEKIDIPKTLLGKIGHYTLVCIANILITLFVLPVIVVIGLFLDVFYPEGNNPLF